MPDLLTHTLVNTVIAGGRLPRRSLAFFVFGGVLPDLVSRVPTLAFARVVRPLLSRWHVDLDWLVHGFAALHLPVGFVPVCAFIVACLPKHLLGGVPRVHAAGLLAAGGAVHLLADLMQEHLRPGYRYLFPLSLRPLELGWFDADLGFVSWPLLLPLAWWAWRRAPQESKSPP